MRKIEKETCIRFEERIKNQHQEMVNSYCVNVFLYDQTDRYYRISQIWSFAQKKKCFVKDDFDFFWTKIILFRQKD